MAEKEIKTWTLASPESVGLRTGAVERTLRRMFTSDADLHDLIVLRRGMPVAEAYFGGYTPETEHQLYSSSKTFTSMAVGCAVGRGLLELTDPVLRFFPEADPGPENSLLRRLRVRDLLTMRVGHAADPWERMTASPEPWSKTFLETPVVYEPGTRFAYETGATYMLGAILTRLTGRNTLELIREWFLREIGAESGHWRLSNEGAAAGGTDLTMIPRDLARFGQLLLRKGVWNGKELIPSSYVEQASEKQTYSATPGVPEYKLEARQGYGFQTWRCSFNAWRADGACGQLIVVCPDEELVAVTNGAMDNERCNLFLDAIREELLPGCEAGVLEEDPAAAASLAAFCAEKNARSDPGGEPLPIGGWDFAPGESRIGLRRLELTEERCRVVWNEGDFSLRWQWNVPVISEHELVTLMDWKPVPLGASMVRRGVWPVLRLQWFTDAKTVNLLLRPRGDRLTVRVTGCVGGDDTVVSL